MGNQSTQDFSGVESMDWEGKQKLLLALWEQWLEFASKWFTQHEIRIFLEARLEEVEKMRQDAPRMAGKDTR